MSEGRPAFQPGKRIIELDFIRGLAVLLVVDYHTLGVFQRAHLPFDSGGLGVSIFFVLSGFLVGGILVREWSASGGIDWKRFLTRRMFKIWPQYYVYLLAVLLTAHRGIRELWGNFLNVQNYTGGIAHTWSLAVEEHAYLLLTLFLVVAGRSAMRFATALRILLVVVACVSVFRAISGWHGINVFAGTQYRIDGILWGLILAMLLQFWRERFMRLQRLRALWIACLLVHPVVIAVSAYYGSSRMLVLGCDSNNLFGIAVIMLLYRHPERSRTVSHALPYRWVAWIGLYSYGIYLWHVSVIEPTFRMVRSVHPGTRGIVIWTLAAVLGIAVGVVMTKVVELPTLRLRDRLFPKREISPLEVGVEETLQGVALESPEPAAGV